MSAKGKHQKRALGWVSTLKEGARMLTGKKLGRAINDRAIAAVGAVPAFKKGGKVKRTGLAKVHKGEVVLSAPKVKMLRKLLK